MFCALGDTGPTVEFWQLWLRQQGTVVPTHGRYCPVTAAAVARTLGGSGRAIGPEQLLRAFSPGTLVATLCLHTDELGEGAHE